jgi:TolB-like protein/Tfp pilus assembly protein PilF
MMPVTAVLILACLGALAWVIWSKTHQSVPSHEEPLLVVLPFQNLGADADSRYFSDGITGEIVDALLRTTQIRVVSPNSSFRFRDVSAARAAKALAATHILSGSVQRGGDRIHMIAQLTDMRNNAVIWSHTYDRAIAQSQALQRDIAVQIADSLDMRLSPNSLKEAQQISPPAYDHYLKGRDLFLQRNLESASVELETSIRLAPDFAKAWSTLAAVRMIRVSYAYAERRQEDDPTMRDSARDAAERALSLDPDNGEALAVLGDLTPSTRLLDVDRLYERALRSEPNNTQLLNWMGVYLVFVGRSREGLNALTRAYEIDRVTPAIPPNLIEAYLETGQYDNARDLISLAWDNKLQGMLFETHVRYFLFRRDWPGLAKYLGALPDYLTAGEAAFARLARETAVALAADASDKFAALRLSWRNATSFEPDDVVQFLVALGDADGAVQFIQTIVADHQRKDHYLVDPGWDALFSANLAALRRDPRIPALFAKWGLFGYWRATNHWPDFCYEPGLPFDCKAEAQKLAASGKAH